MSWGPNPAPRPGLSPAPSSPQASPYQGLQSATCVPLPLLAPRRAPAQHTASARMGLGLVGCAPHSHDRLHPPAGPRVPQQRLGGSPRGHQGLFLATAGPVPRPWLAQPRHSHQLLHLCRRPAALPLMLAFTCEGPWWGPGLEPSARWAARPEVLAWGILREC